LEEDVGLSRRRNGERGEVESETDRKRQRGEKIS